MSEHQLKKNFQYCKQRELNHTNNMYEKRNEKRSSNYVSASITTHVEYT